MCTRELQFWRDSAAVDWMPSKLKPHRCRRTLYRRGQQNLRVGKTHRSECRPYRHEESVGGTSPTAAGQQCTEGIRLARGPILAVLRTEPLKAEMEY